ncbi:hypothetical protein OIU76_025379 [Salix suchowensis]|nr:hypothetical protein OIU76_025379 [Salix suchowensis]
MAGFAGIFMLRVFSNSVTLHNYHYQLLDHLGTRILSRGCLLRLQNSTTIKFLILWRRVSLLSSPSMVEVIIRCGGLPGIKISRFTGVIGFTSIMVAELQAIRLSSSFLGIRVSSDYP